MKYFTIQNKKDNFAINSIRQQTNRNIVLSVSVLLNK